MKHVSSVPQISHTAVSSPKLKVKIRPNEVLGGQRTDSLTPTDTHPAPRSCSQAQHSILNSSNSQSSLFNSFAVAEPLAVPIKLHQTSLTPTNNPSAGRKTSKKLSHLHSHNFSLKNKPLSLFTQHNTQTTNQLLHPPQPQQYFTSNQSQQRKSLLQQSLSTSTLHNTQRMIQAHYLPMNMKMKMATPRIDPRSHRRCARSESGRLRKGITTS